MTTKKHTIIIAFTTFILHGCFDSEKSIYSICEETPEICLDIQTQGWCQEERSALIRNRHRQITVPNDQQNLYNSLINWKEFSACIEIASNIKRKNIADRDPTKSTSFVNSVTEIEKLEIQTKNSDLPQLLYYHWAQDGNERNIIKLKKLDDHGKLNTSELQFMMASYYGKNDRSRAIKAQYKALSLLTESDLELLDHNTFASISTYYFQLKNIEQSYVWAQVAIKFGLKANLYSSLTTQLQRQGIALNTLDVKAQNIYISINNLEFISYQ